MEKLSSLNFASTSCKTKSFVFSFLVLSIGLIAIIGQISSVNCALPYYDPENSNSRQALLEEALRSFGIYHDINLNNYPESGSEIIKESPYPKFHQLERKGGRAPTLRLRFGRRSDPSWSPLLGKSNSQETVN